MVVGALVDMVVGGVGAVVDELVGAGAVEVEVAKGVAMEEDGRGAMSAGGLKLW